jgi:hypothetical protein
MPKRDKVFVRVAEPGEAPGIYLEEEGGVLWPVGWDYEPRPADVPDIRARLQTEWMPKGKLAEWHRVAESFRTGSSGPPDWEDMTLGHAALWYVGDDMCDLLAAAAPDMPEVVLSPEMLPDHSGFVVFQRCLSGLDADNVGLGNVQVGAYLWGPALWQGGPPFSEPGAPVPCLGITCYRPINASVGMVPIGSLVWALGTSCDKGLTGDPVRDASMAEDRRRLAALWSLSAQPTLTSSTIAALPRQARRREERAGRQAPDVRVVVLRARPQRDVAVAAPSGRTYRHRWAVSGHWKTQRYGPKNALVKTIYRNPYLAGPDGAPMLGTPRVKVWKR